MSQCLIRARQRGTREACTEPFVPHSRRLRAGLWAGSSECGTKGMKGSAKQLLAKTAQGCGQSVVVRATNQFRGVRRVAPRVGGVGPSLWVSREHAEGEVNRTLTDCSVSNIIIYHVARFLNSTVCFLNSPKPTPPLLLRHTRQNTAQNMNNMI